MCRMGFSINFYYYSRTSYVRNYFYCHFHMLSVICVINAITHWPSIVHQQCCINQISRWLYELGWYLTLLAVSTFCKRFVNICCGCTVSLISRLFSHKVYCIVTLPDTILSARGGTAIGAGGVHIPTFWMGQCGTNVEKVRTAHRTMCSNLSYTQRYGCCRCMEIDDVVCYCKRNMLSCFCMF